MKTKSMARCVALISLGFSCPLLFAQEAKESAGDVEAAAKPVPVTEVDTIRAAMDKELTVEGKVTETNKSSSGHNYLNFEDTEFYIFVHSRSLSNFEKGEPADLYLDKTVHITGTIEEYKGKAQIVLDRPEQIKVVGEATAPASKPGETPVEEVEKESALLEATNLEAVRAAKGKRVRVRGFVSETRKSATTGANFLEFKESEFAVVALGRILEKFTEGEPSDIYKDKWVEIEGEIVFYKDMPQIELESPGQIKVVPEPAKREGGPEEKPAAANGTAPKPAFEGKVDPRKYFTD